MPKLSEFRTVGTAMASSDCFVAVIGPTGAKEDVLVPRSLIPTGITAPTTKLPVKGDNAGGIVAQAIVAVGNVGAATIAAGTDVVVISAALTAPLVLTLPALAGMPPGHHITIRDPHGYVSATNTVSVDGAGAETVNGLAGPVLCLSAARQINSVGAAWGLDDWGMIIPGGGGGSGSIANTTLPLKGNNAGGAIAQGIFQMGNANATAPAGTNVVILSAAFTATRVLTLPSSTGYAIGDSILILDPNGFAGSAANALTAQPAAGDTLNGIAGVTYLTNLGRQMTRIVLGAAGAWGAVNITTAGCVTAQAVLGVTNGSNALAGYVGEVIEQNVPVTSLVSMTNGASFTVTSISLPAGDWDVGGVLGFQTGNPLTLNALAGGIHTVAATYPPDENSTVIRYQASVFNTCTFFLALPPVRYNLTSTTTIYLIALGLFSGATLGACGKLRARRVR